MNNNFCPMAKNLRILGKRSKHSICRRPWHTTFREQWIPLEIHDPGICMEMGPACQRLVQHPNSEFWKQNPHQNLCSRNLPATPPQQNLVSGMLLVCNRILQNMWFSMTNICSMTEHGVLFCNISDLFPQRKNLWIFPRNYPATTVSQIVSWLCPLATYLPHATIVNFKKLRVWGLRASWGFHC